MTTHGAVRMENANGRGWHWYGRCERCWKERVLYVSHIEPKGTYPHLRWHEDNAFAFCYSCHMNWWHKHPREAEEFATRMLGARRDRLATHARMRVGTQHPGDIELTLKLRLRSVAPGGIPGVEY